MTLVYYDDIFLEHDTGGHPENKLRLVGIMERLPKVAFADRLKFMKPRDATPEEIALVHEPRYIEAIGKFCEGGGGYLDLDTIASAKTYEAAIAAAGAGIGAVERILDGQDKSAFCLVRPPGHHALVDQSMGFCVFNNIAIAGRWLQKNKGMKIAIIDFDVHHGNGTQDVFYGDPDSIFVSLHRYPFYPGPSGSPDNTGEGKGEGLNINIAMDTFIYGVDYITHLEEALDKVAEFKPGFILVSAGFDGYSHDPIGGLNLESEDYSKIGEVLADAAARLTDGRIFFRTGGTCRAPRA